MNSGLNPAPSSNSADTLPLTCTVPEVGLRIPQIICSSVLLPDPFGPMIPTVSPQDIERHVAERIEALVVAPDAE